MQLFSYSALCKHTILLGDLLRRLRTVLHRERRCTLHLFIPCFLHWHRGENNFWAVVFEILLRNALHPCTSALLAGEPC